MRAKSLGKKLIKFYFSVVVAQAMVSPYISIKDRWRIVHRRRDGIKLAVIAREIGCSVNAASYIFRKYLETGDVKDRPRSGRPCKVTERDSRHLVRSALRKVRKVYQLLLKNTI